MEDRVSRLEDMFAYMVETQRMMADNLVKLTEVEQDQNERIAANEERTRASDERFNILLQEARADRMEHQRRYEELKAKDAEQKAESDQKFAEQKAESDRKFAEQKAESDRKFAEQKAESDRKFAEQRAESDRKFEALLERIDRKLQ